MAGDRTVAFIFELIDRFSPMAQRLGQAAASAEKMIMGMGRSADAAERSINTLAANQGRVAQSFERSARAAREAERANELYYKSAARQERMQLQMLERHQAKQQLIASGQLPGAAGRRHAGAMDMMNAYVGFTMAQGLQTGFGKFLDDANLQRVGRQKMGLVGFKGDLMRDAEQAASAMSKKYGNLSKGEVFEMLHEGVAIHGNAHESIANIEQQAKLMSFISAYEGGKHSMHGGKTFREVQAWIKSMEMKGTLNETDPAKRKQMIDDYVQAGMAIKVAYPSSQLNLTDMLLMQKRAGTAWYNLSDEFRFGYAPAMAQERGGQIVGTALMSSFASIRGGKKLSKAELATMRQYGLLDSKSGRWTDEFQKTWANNPFLAAEDIAGRVARAKHLDPHDDKQKEQLSNELTKAFSWLFPNRTASTQFLDLVFNNENFKKHAEYMSLVRKEMKEIEKAAENGSVFYASTKGGAEASAGKQWHNLMAAIGGPMLDPYIVRMNKFASGFNRLSEGLTSFWKNNPGIAASVGSGSTMALGLLTGIAGLAGVGFLLGGLKMGLGMVPGLGLIGGAARMGAGVAAGGLTLPLAVASVAAQAMMMRGSAAAAVPLAGGASSRMIAGMTAAGRAAEVVAPLWLRVARMFSWVGLAGYGAYSLYENRDRLRAFGRDASNVGQNAYYMRLFSGDTMQAINKMLSKYDLPPLDVSSIQKALSTAGQLIMQAAQKLLNTDIGKFIRFQMGLMSFKDFYGDNPRNSPWLDGASEEMIRKVEAKVAAEKIKERNDEFAGYYDKFGRTYWNDPLSTMIQREQNPRFYGSASVIADLQRYGDPDYLAGKGGGYLGGFSASAANIDFGSAARGEGMREIAIRTEVTQATPLNGQVTVRVEGTVNGPVNGGGTANVTGAVQAKSDASRGESAPAGK